MEIKAISSLNNTKVIEREIAALEAEIDRLVYDLYGLTEDEIRIIDPSYQPKVKESQRKESQFEKRFNKGDQENIRIKSKGLITG